MKKPVSYAGLMQIVRNLVSAMQGWREIVQTFHHLSPVCYRAPPANTSTDIRYVMTPVYFVKTGVDGVGATCGAVVN